MHRRVVVLGDPGSGKTDPAALPRPCSRGTWLAKTAAASRRNLASRESGYLPIFLPFRQIGSYLKTLPDDGTKCNNVLLDFFRRSLTATVSGYRKPSSTTGCTGKAVVLLDGLDEVPDPDLRPAFPPRRGLCPAYPTALCRNQPHRRLSGAARLAGRFAATTVDRHDMADIEQFFRPGISCWRPGVRGAQRNEYAASRPTSCRGDQGNERIAKLAINPLMLTVIAMVHRDRVELPETDTPELYAEAVDVLLGKWDEVKGEGRTGSR